MIAILTMGVAQAQDATERVRVSQQFDKVEAVEADVNTDEVILLSQKHYDSLLMKIASQEKLLMLNNKHLKMVVGPRLIRKRDQMVRNEIEATKE